MSIISQSIDLLKLQGARKITKDGKDYVLIDLSKSRAKEHKNGSVYLELEAVGKKEVGQYGDTHFIKERSTKEERMQKVQMPIIGNGKELSFGDSAPRKIIPTVGTNSGKSANTWMEDDNLDVPF